MLKIKIKVSHYGNKVAERECDSFEEAYDEMEKLENQYESAFGGDN